MARHTAVIHVDFESQDDGPEPEAIADAIARDIDGFLKHDSAYVAVSSYLDDVRDIPPDISPTGRWQVGFYLQPPVEEVVTAASRSEAMADLERRYGDQAQLVYLEPEEAD